MTLPVDPITDADLQAYVDEQLDVARRIEVEAWLSRNPAAAARVMSDLRTRDELRLALADRPTFARIATGDAARRLERGLLRDRLLNRLGRIAALIAVGALGWLAHGRMENGPIGNVIASTPPPAFVQDAVMAHRTALLRAEMHSQPEVPSFDPGEIRAATAIVLPVLPKHWRVVDVQVFPSKYGPSLEMAVESDTIGPLSLFAVRPGGFDVREPATTTASAMDAGVAANVHDSADGKTAAAYWQIGEVAYALVARTGEQELGREAERLARTLY